MRPQSENGLFGWTETKMAAKPSTSIESDSKKANANFG
jgi:hypothetical protein